MLKVDVLKYFGGTTKRGASARCARFLDINISAVMQWGEIIPECSAYKLEVMTAGALKVDPEIYRRRKLRRAVA